MVDNSARFQRRLDGSLLKPFRWSIEPRVKGPSGEGPSGGSSLISIAKSRRVIRARTALEAGIALRRDRKVLKFGTFTIDYERAQFSKTYVIGGINGCWEALIKRLRREFGIVEFCKVTVTMAVSCHIHAIIDIGWVGQRFLSDIWEEITDCPVVDIQTLYYGRGLRNYLANYVSNQGRLGYSQGWIFKGWRFMTQKIFSRLKNRYLPKWDASPYCCNIFYRYVWYRRVLPFLVKDFNRNLLPRFALLDLPVFWGNWLPKVINSVELGSMLGVV